MRWKLEIMKLTLFRQSKEAELVLIGILLLALREGGFTVQGRTGYLAASAGNCGLSWSRPGFDKDRVACRDNCMVARLSGLFNLLDNCA